MNSLAPFIYFIHLTHDKHLTHLNDIEWEADNELQHTFKCRYSIVSVLPPLGPRPSRR